MKAGRVLGLLIGASLLVGFEPVAEAMPAAGPATAPELSVGDGLVVKTVTAVGVAHRSARRTARRTTRRQ
jgi:hypothetical protein